MKFIIAVLGDDCGDELHDLREWLKDDEDLRGVPLLSSPGSREVGEMGGGSIAAAVEAAFTSKELLVALAGSVGGWLSARAASQRTRVRIRRGDVEIEIDTARMRDADKIARTIQENFNGMT